MADSYELFYSSGGHCGPYHDLAEAEIQARRRLRGLAETTTSVSIVERTTTGVGGYGSIVKRITREDLAPASDAKFFRDMAVLKAVKMWAEFTDKEKKLVRYGLFPAHQMVAALAEGHDRLALAEALMQCAEKAGGMIA